MEKNFKELTISDFREHLGSDGPGNSRDVFLASDLHLDRHTSKLVNEPFRFNGFLAIICKKGSFPVEINLTRYEMKPDSLLLYVPGHIMRIYEADGPERALDLTIAAVNRDFLGESRIDMGHLFKEALSVLKQPIIHLDSDEMDIIADYLDIGYRLNARDPMGLENSLYGLISAIFNYFGDIWQEKLKQAPNLAEAGATARSRLVFDSFLELVAEYHDTERGMSFYAEKLCLSPKYLSKVIRKVSGKGGPELIDDFVILEAKNLLRYSDCPIKEIVYRLNFSNSSVFYKFFKSHTGMTPSQYRK